MPKREKIRKRKIPQGKKNIQKYGSSFRKLVLGSVEVADYERIVLACLGSVVIPPLGKVKVACLR